MSRNEFGYPRTVCACKKCKVYCSYMPGYLIPNDLARLIPKGVDPLQWAEKNLLASPGALVSYRGDMFRIHTLVPAVKKTGECIHLSPSGFCGIHSNAPFGCAFFDCGPTPEPLAHLGLITVLTATKEKNSLYNKIWKHLDDLGHRQSPPEILRDKMADAFIP